MGESNDEDIEDIQKIENNQLNSIQQQILEKISILKDDIEKAKQFGADIRNPINILKQAESALKNNDFKTTNYYIELCKNAINKSKAQYQNAIDKVQDLQGHTKIMLKTIELKINHEKDSGLMVNDAENYLQKAKAALTNSKFQIAQKYAKTAMKTCRELQKKYEEVRENLQNLRTSIDNSKKFIDTIDAEKLFRQSVIKNNEGDYTEALKLVNKAITTIEYIKKKNTPNLILKCPKAFTLKSGTWSKCQLEISNDGKVHAHEINLRISEEIESRGHLHLGNLSAGEKKDIEIGLKADKVGELPININLIYTNPIKNEQLESQIAFWVNIEPGEAEGVLGPDRILADHLRKKATLSISKRGYEYEVGLKTSAEEGEASEVFEFIKVSPASRTDLINQINDIVTFSNLFSCTLDDHRDKKDVNESKKIELNDNIQNLSSLGNLMYGMFLPASIQKHFKNINEPLLLKTNDNEIPWEMLNDGTDFICLKVPLGRRLRSRESSRVNPITEGDKISFLFIVNTTEDLEGAEKEMDYITSRLSSDIEIKTLTKSSATNASILSALQSGSYDIIHYASHAEFNMTSPDESALITANKNKIYAQEIKRLLGGRPFVFLNACGSGMEKICEDGKSYTGSDTEGLASSFILGGALAFIGASWPVHDISSGILASEFYKHFLKGETVGDSLLKAKIHLKNERPNDINWAAFMLYGDPTIRLSKKILT